MFGALIAQVWTGDGDHLTTERFRFSIAAGIIVAYICLLCLLVFSTYNPPASVFSAFSWRAGVVLSFSFATSSIDKGLEYLAAARNPSPGAAPPANPSVQPSAHATGDGE